MRTFFRIVAMSWLIGCAAPARADSIEVDGVTRTYSALPAASRPAPLVIVLHGNGQNGSSLMERTAWPLFARRDQFGVVFPDGLNRAWADMRGDEGRAGGTPPPGTDDVAFIVRLVAAFVADGRADPKRVYVTGISNGGAMAMTLACVRAELFAAAASVIMNLTGEFAARCHPSRPLPMLLINGTADPLIPYEGGHGSSYFAADGFWSAADTVGFWRRINGCEAADGDAADFDDRNPSDLSTVTRIGSRCPPGRDVLHYRINGGGHRMPGMFPDANFPTMATAILGPQNGDIDGAETIWAFFAKFP